MPNHDDYTPLEPLAATPMARSVGGSDGPDIQTMATLMRQMLGHIPKDKQLHGKVTDYLKRHDLQGSPLRCADEDDERHLTSGEDNMSGATNASMFPALYLVSYQNHHGLGRSALQSALFSCDREPSADDILLWRGALGGKAILSFQKLASSSGLEGLTERRHSWDDRTVTFYPL